jgi:hypothetical protein
MVASIVAITATDGEIAAGADDFATGEQEVAHGWGHQVDLQFHRQYAGRRSHKTQRRTAARAVESGHTVASSPSRNSPALAS